MLLKYVQVFDAFGQAVYKINFAFQISIDRLHHKRLFKNTSQLSSKNNKLFHKVSTVVT